MILNAKLPISRTKKYLEKKKLTYIRYKLVKKPWNPNFERGESIFTSFAYRKHRYEIDAMNSEVNPVTINARWYQSFSYFIKTESYLK